MTPGHNAVSAYKTKHTLPYQAGYYQLVQPLNQCLHQILTWGHRGNSLCEPVIVAHGRIIRHRDHNLGYLRWHRSGKLHLNIPLVGILIRNSVRIRRVFTIQDILRINLMGKGNASNKEELGESMSSFV